MRLIFMGTTDFSAYILESIYGNNFGEIVAIYTQPPRPAGRRYDIKKTPVHVLAERLGLPIFTPKTLQSTDAQEMLSAFHADIAVVVAYGLIVPQEVLDIPRMGFLNIHASLLPRWRGAAPIERAILAGDDVTGITIMKMDAGLDTGPMIAKAAISIVPEMTRNALAYKLERLGADVLIDILPTYVNGDVDLVLQPDEGACYAKKIDTTETQLVWHRNADELARTVWAFSPRPGAWMMVEGKRIKVLSATYSMNDIGRNPGDVLTNRLEISCGRGVFSPQILQRAGGKPQSIDDFIRGFKVPCGTVLTCSAIS